MVNVDSDTLKELADSIAQYGVLIPVLAKKEGEDYRIVAGIRRFLAAKQAGIKEVPVIVK